ncbi:DNA-directed RNA polymerases II and IV subunit 5A-like [Solanum pennellii]|uniref:DNA-directed RNA polymerases II and IV subunit 5A-like n=1 Tax=Solanum pennellii TaxID=28526 RepID=A0ABM1GTW6_SOLPN|nr:DNA-directed RNA polymerases II and IV subunit 5A-like [Solanum pennellii]
MSTLSEDEVTILYKVRKTVMEMLNDRGYLVEEFEIKMSKQEFLHKYGVNMKRGDLEILKARRNDDESKIYVFFPDGAKVGVKEMRPYAERLRQEDVSQAIFVVKQKLTPKSDQFISEVSTMLNLEVFQEAELMVNVKDHAIVPEHQPLTKEEKKSLLEQYTVKESQLPRIQITDPIARYYGLKRGQVVKIIRPSETAGRYVTYRYVV